MSGRTREYDQNRAMLRLLARTREQFVGVKTAVGNRLGIKADGEAQNVEERNITERDNKILHVLWANVEAYAKQIEKNMEEVLRRFRVYTEWLRDIKGVGPNHAAWIIGEFDIYTADTVSKMWQFAGLSPTMVLGQKSVAKGDYKPELGVIVGTLPNKKDGEERHRVMTQELIRGDKQTLGFLSPFNKRLRVALLGRLATSFIMCRPESYYSSQFYRSYKDRLSHSEKTVEHKVKNEWKPVAWKDVNAARRDRAARRYMVKMFLADLYSAWRTCEGLPVRRPYAEEYLGKKHTERLIAEPEEMRA